MGSLDSLTTADHIDVDIAIIGGGPTGLFSALLAYQLGLTTCIIDAKPSTLEFGRADAMNARTQQYLEVAGCLDELLPMGIKCNTSSTFANGEFVSRQSHWWTGLEHCFHKNFLMIGQPAIEKVFVSHLTTPVCHGEQVVSISEDASHVFTTTDKGRKIRSKYAIAADGARSFVRNTLGLSFTGTKPEMVWAVLDTFLDTDFPVCNEIITFQLNGQSRVSWIPRERGLARFYVLLEGEGEITRERAEASIKEHLKPYRIDFVRAEWFSTFEVKERIASTFLSQQGDGRILLAGDAAHVHSVNGGQGLNTGIADAFALTWRLAIALKGKNVSPAAERLLMRSYDIERRKIAQGVIDVAAKLVRDTVHTAKIYVSTIERNAAYITGMGVSYDGLESPLIRESAFGIWKAGHRCPDIPLLTLGDSPARSQRLYTLAAGHYGKFTILHIGPPSTAVDEAEMNSRDLSLSASGIGRLLRVYPKDYAPVMSADSSDDCETYSTDYDLGTDRVIIVVRPDMYIGFVGNKQDTWSLYLQQLMAE